MTESILTRYAEGASINEIAVALNVTYSKVRHVIEKSGARRSVRQSRLFTTNAKNALVLHLPRNGVTIVSPYSPAPWYPGTNGRLV